MNDSHHEGTKTTKSTNFSLDEQTESLATDVVDSVFKVYRALGPGLLESAYEACLVHHLKRRGLQVESQKALPLVFEGLRIEAAYRVDIIVEGRIILELKAIDSFHPIHEAQLLTYLRLSGISLGFLVNFNAPTFKDALKRKIF